MGPQTSARVWYVSGPPTGRQDSNPWDLAPGLLYSRVLRDGAREKVRGDATARRALSAAWSLRFLDTPRGEIRINYVAGGSGTVSRSASPRSGDPNFRENPEAGIVAEFARDGGDTL